MASLSLILIVAVIVFAGAMFRPRVLQSPLWRATATPLASIIGSGFLVCGPILAHTAGHFAWLAMAALCLLAYVFGAAIRYNIAHVEPCLDGSAPSAVRVLEHVASATLMCAYFISITFYLNLFAAFALRTGGIIDPFWIRALATAVIAALGTLGAIGGLRGLEWLEVGAVGLKLAVIGGLMVALAAAGGFAVADGSFAWPTLTHAHGVEELRVILGLVILVQGFETSRYLSASYDAATRIKTMRWAQGLSTGIYILFLLLITPYFTDGLPTDGGETQIIDMLAPLGAAVGPLIILVALASQLSAAIADLNGAGGLLAEFSHHRLSVKAGNVAATVVAIAVTWSADIYEIIAFATRAFVAYYALQAVQASYAAFRQGDFKRMALFAAATLLAVVIVIFAVPANV